MGLGAPPALDICVSLGGGLDLSNLGCKMGPGVYVHWHL